MTDERPPEEFEEVEEFETPMSFKVMIAATVIYLGWRLVQGVAWLIDRI